MSQYNFVHLGDAIFVGRKFVVTDVDGSGLFGEGAYTFHVVAVGTESGSTKNIF
jgi:hypothetical protein